ncbi:MAG: Stage III sporulation protein AC/AD protein family protein [Firmicutes bacterium ADurb.Bin506]|nr:MAG: Stage III sporulation protein AC/AD protein family protein [Firmicutes bacterium ADurb.Bin506]
MQVLQLFGMALIALAAVVVVRQIRPDMGMVASVAAGLVFVAIAVSRLSYFASAIDALADSAGVSRIHIDIVLRVVGVAYLASFAADVCRDAGEGALASRVELAGNAIILGMASPLIFALLETVMRVLPR